MLDEAWANNVVDILLNENEQLQFSHPPHTHRTMNNNIADASYPPSPHVVRKTNASTWFTEVHGVERLIPYSPNRKREKQERYSPNRKREKQERLNILYQDIKAQGEERRFRAGQQLSAIEAMEWERWRRMEVVETNEIGDNHIRHLQVGSLVHFGTAPSLSIIDSSL